MRTFKLTSFRGIDSVPVKTLPKSGLAIVTESLYSIAEDTNAIFEDNTADAGYTVGKIAELLNKYNAILAQSQNNLLHKKDGYGSVVNAKFTNLLASVIPEKGMVEDYKLCLDVPIFEYNVADNIVSADDLVTHLQIAMQLMKDTLEGGPTTDQKFGKEGFELSQTNLKIKFAHIDDNTPLDSDEDYIKAIKRSLYGEKKDGWEVKYKTALDLAKYYDAKYKEGIAELESDYTTLHAVVGKLLVQLQDVSNLVKTQLGDTDKMNRFNTLLKIIALNIYNIFELSLKYYAIVDGVLDRLNDTNNVVKMKLVANYGKENPKSDGVEVPESLQHEDPEQEELENGYDQK